VTRFLPALLSLTVKTKTAFARRLSSLPHDALDLLTHLLASVVLLRAPGLAGSPAGVSLLKKLRASRNYKAMRRAIPNATSFRRFVSKGASRKQKEDLVSPFAPFVPDVVDFFVTLLSTPPNRSDR